MDLAQKINHKKEEYYENFKRMPKIVILNPDTFKNAISSMRGGNYEEIYHGEYNSIFGLVVIQSDHLRSDEVMVGG